MSGVTGKKGGGVGRRYLRVVKQDSVPREQADYAGSVGNVVIEDRRGCRLVLGFVESYHGRPDQVII